MNAQDNVNCSVLVLRREYSGRTRSIHVPLLLMPWRLSSPGYKKQPWYWLCSKWALVCHREGFTQPVPLECLEMIENLNIFSCFPKTILHIHKGEKFIDVVLYVFLPAAVIDISGYLYMVYAKECTDLLTNTNRQFSTVTLAPGRISPMTFYQIW